MLKSVTFAQRIIDYVPLTIEHSLTQALVNHLQQPLIKQLDVTGPNSMESVRELLAEDPGIVEKRSFLGDRLRKLEAARKELMFFFESIPEKNLPDQAPFARPSEYVSTPAVRSILILLKAVTEGIFLADSNLLSG